MILDCLGRKPQGENIKRPKAEGEAAEKSGLDGSAGVWYTREYLRVIDSGQDCEAEESRASCQGR